MAPPARTDHVVTVDPDDRLILGGAAGAAEIAGLVV